MFLCIFVILLVYQKNRDYYVYQSEGDGLPWYFSMKFRVHTNEAPPSVL
jgi:hypothetical protein